MNSLTNESLQYLMTVRRYLHSNPEPSNEEYNTCEFIMGQLKSFGLSPKKVLTGVICDIGKSSVNRIAFRADTDALKIQENNTVDYASKNGFMHACGHDGHTAILLNVARILSAQKNPPALRLIFQFGEEGEGEGAKQMIEHGALLNISQIYALHVNPDLPIGTIGICYGAMFAGSLEFDIDFYGKAAHVAFYQKAHDALLSANQIMTAMRDLSAKYQTVCNVGKITGGNARNIVADYVNLQCTTRYYEKHKFEALTMELDNALMQTDKNNNTTHKFNTLAANFPLINHAYAVDNIKQALSGTDIKIVEVKPQLTAEDFAMYLQNVQGAMVWLGTGDDKHNSPLHSDTFDFDETALLTGTEYFLRLVENQKDQKR